jgi:hypothetical protein
MAGPREPQVLLQLPDGAARDALRAGLTALRCMPINLPFEASERYGFLNRLVSCERVFLVMNCANIGCPALRHEADVADRLNGPLEDATQKVLSDRTRNRIESDTLKVSGIFNGYGQDFKNGWRGANTLGQFLALYCLPLRLNADTSSKLSSGKRGIEFLDHDWRLNAAGGSDKSGKS